MSVFVHPKGICESRNVGAGTRIWAFAHVMGGAIIGTDCNIGDCAYVENQVVIGHRVTIKNGAMIMDGTYLEDDVFIGSNVSFTNDRYPRSKSRPPEYPKTTIRRGASIGANVVILAGVTVGEDAMVGAGSVVTKDIPAHVVAFGNPARVTSFLNTEMITEDRFDTSVRAKQVLPEVELRRVKTVFNAGETSMDAELLSNLPFSPKRFLVLKGLQHGQLCSGQVHFQCSQLFMLLSGSITFLVDNGRARRSVKLCRLGDTILVPPRIWHSLIAATPETIVGVLASEPFDAADHIYDYREFRRKIANHST